MKKVFTGIFAITISCVFFCCGNDEAKKKYEDQKQLVEQIKKDNKRIIDSASACGATQAELMRINIERSKLESDATEKLVELAKEAGLDKE